MCSLIFLSFILSFILFSLSLPLSVALSSCVCVLFVFANERESEGAEWLERQV